MAASERRASRSHYDLIVLGGGPSGATTASVVARRKGRVLLLEKDIFPRHQVGESLLPSTIHGVLALTGARKKVLSAGFYRKYGGTFLWGESEKPWSFDFSWARGVPAHALQVERAKFDHLLLKHARTLGVDVIMGARATKVIQEGGRAGGVEYADSRGEVRAVSSSYVIDASGANSPFFSVCGKRIYSESLQNAAVYGYFRGAKRLPGKKKGNIHCISFGEGWFWYIPLSETLTSVGVIVSSRALAGKKADRSFLEEMIGRCPLIQEFLAEARIETRGAYGKVRTRRDWTYCNSSFSSPGFCLVGDAACFVDPVFSTGVHLGTFGALQAARAVNSSLADPAHEEIYFREFEREYKIEYGRFYQFVAGFYSMNAQAESYFWSAKRMLGSKEESREAFARLVSGSVAAGKIYSGRIQKKLPVEIQRAVTFQTRREMLEPGALKTGPAKRFLSEFQGHNLDPIASLDRRGEGLSLSRDRLGWSFRA